MSLIVRVVLGSVGSMRWFASAGEQVQVRKFTTPVESRLSGANSQRLFDSQPQLVFLRGADNPEAYFWAWLQVLVCILIMNTQDRGLRFWFLAEGMCSNQWFCKTWQKTGFNQYLLRLRRQRDHLFRRSKRLTKDHRLSVAYRKVSNLYVAELRFAEKEYYSRPLYDLTSERFSREPHRWWKKAKSICGITSKTHLPTLVADGPSWSSSLDKAERLNSSFAQQCTASVMNPALPTETVPTVRKTFSFRLLDSDAVQKKLSFLNVWKSTGLDGFSNRLLKECAEVLSPPLAHVLNCSLQSGVFSDGLETGPCQPRL